MTKKILGICAALVALGALAIGPATAMAETHLTDTSGGVTTTVEAGAKILASSTGISTFVAGEVVVECNENAMTGTVHRETGGNVEFTIEKAQFDSNLNETGTDCRNKKLGLTRVTVPALTNEAGGTKHWCVENTEGDNFQVFGGSCTGAIEPLTFILDVTGITSCPYAREGVVTGTFTTPGAEHKASTLAVAGEPVFKREGTNFLCPAEGKITNMEFDLYTDTAATFETNNWNDAASLEDPVWLAE